LYFELRVPVPRVFFLQGLVVLSLMSCLLTLAGYGWDLFGAGVFL